MSESETMDGKNLRRMTIASYNSLASIFSCLIWGNWRIPKDREETLMSDVRTILGNPLAFPNTLCIPVQTY